MYLLIIYLNTTLVLKWGLEQGCTDTNYQFHNTGAWISCFFVCFFSHADILPHTRLLPIMPVLLLDVLKLFGRIRTRWILVYL